MSGEVPPPPPPEREPEPTRVERSETAETTQTTGSKRKRRSPWIPFWIAAVLIIGLGAAAYFLLAGSDDASGEVILQSTADDGPDPFTDSVADMRVDQLTSNGDDIAGDPVSGVEGGDSSIESVDGATPGLYGGTENEQVCDPQAMVDFLMDNPDKAQAWADAEGIEVDDIPDYVDSLTPVILREDTRVTNHGFVDGTANAFQAVLQAGTAVLVDDRGVPRARCACGNPLTEPEATETKPDYSGTKWSNFDENRLVNVLPSGDTIDRFTLVDVETGDEFEQDAGGGGDGLTVDELLNLKIPTQEVCELPKVAWVDGIHPDSGTDTTGYGFNSVAEVVGVEGDEELQAQVGDLTGDGADDGVVITSNFCGGSTFYSDAYAFDADGSLLGKLPTTGQLENLSIVDGGIELDTLTLGPSDPRLDPSVRTHVRFEWNGSEFAQTEGDPASGGDSTDSSGDSTTAGSPIPEDAELCRPLVYADTPATSCEFALAVADAVASDPDAGTYEVTSPETGGTYTVTCGDAPGNAGPNEQGYHVTICEGGDGAVVYLA